MFDMAYAGFYDPRSTQLGPRKATVYEFERGLLYFRGRFVKELEPGYYNYWWSRRYSIVKVDQRLSTLTVASQEISTSEGIPVRISLLCRFHVEDARKNFESSQTASGSVYADLQVALREVVAARTLDEIMSEKSAMNDELLQKAIAFGELYGLSIEAVQVRDISTSGDIKKAYAEVLRARKAGEASLERARGETAALRSLANAARLMAEQPALMQLRALQALSDSPGSTLVFGTDAVVRGSGNAKQAVNAPADAE